MDFKRALAAVAFLATVPAPAASPAYVASSVQPPLVSREFRGVWIASVGNLDWPSKAGLSTADQKAELTKLLDRVAQLRLNAVLLQVRPACDALYASQLEPWSEYLTGQMGRAPEPFYDPLAFAVAEAHRRGLELHAWFNPFRARYSTTHSGAASSHVSRTRPDLVRAYGKQFWLDPGEQAAQDLVVNAILDVVRRYDIDGAHLDDYFYPYPEKDAAGRAMAFPDDVSWKRYVSGGGKLGREDWRRENINRFIARLYPAIKAEKAWVKFGISPFGIWRPGQPQQIKGMDAFDELFADSRKWLANGWLDYFAPQLYWSIERKEQSFPVLLQWWTEQNSKLRHVWPGLAASNVGDKWSAREIMNQISRARGQSGVTGHIHWGVKRLTQNRDGLADSLASGPYSQPALVPVSPWLDKTPPGKPKLAVEASSTGGVRVSWEPTGEEKVWLWTLQWKSGSSWRTEVVPGSERSRVLKSASGSSTPEAVAVSAVDRCGNASAGAVVEKQAARK
jgi:uncharacterized lipoprotein YddW (UPF0748 family)